MNEYCLCVACGVALAPEGESFCGRCHEEMMAGDPAWGEGEDMIKRNDGDNTLFVDFGAPSGGRYICPRCGVSNGDNLPVVVGDGIEAGGCRQCFDDCGRAERFFGSICLEVLTGTAVSIPVWW
jgi:hypothetical protein